MRNWRRELLEVVLIGLFPITLVATAVALLVAFSSVANEQLLRMASLSNVLAYAALPSLFHLLTLGLNSRRLRELSLRRLAALEAVSALAYVALVCLAFAPLPRALETWRGGVAWGYLVVVLLLGPMFVTLLALRIFGAPRDVSPAG